MAILSENNKITRLNEQQWKLNNTMDANRIPEPDVHKNKKNKTGEAWSVRSMNTTIDNGDNIKEQNYTFNMNLQNNNNQNTSTIQIDDFNCRPVIEQHATNVTKKKKWGHITLYNNLKYDDKQNKTILLNPQTFIQHR